MSEPPTVRAAIISPTTHPCAPRPCRHALEEMDYKGGATTLLLATPYESKRINYFGQAKLLPVTLLKCGVRRTRYRRGAYSNRVYYEYTNRAVGCNLIAPSR